MSLLLLLLLLQGTGWLLLAMANLPLGKTVENRLLAPVAATKLLRELKELSGCSISFSGMWCRKLPSKLPCSVWGCAITGSAPVQWILLQFIQSLLSIFLARSSVQDERKSITRIQYTSVHALFTALLMFLVSHLCSAPPPGPNSAGTWNAHAYHLNREWWIAVAVMAMHFRFFDQSMIYLLFPCIVRHRSMSGE